MGFQTLRAQIAAIPNTLQKPNVSRTAYEGLQSLLDGGEYLVKPGDKNLGPCILPASWYTGECKNQLRDQNTYEMVKEAPVKAMWNWLKVCIPRFAEVSCDGSPSTAPFSISEQEVAFLLHLSDDTCQLPEFYVTPKVHKTPLRGRPIIPSHLWLTSNVSTWLNEKLQPLIPFFLWILRDSKQLMRKLLTLSVP